MKTLITLAVAMIVGLGAVGCAKEEVKKKTETTTTTPGGETKESTEVKVETKGENPPPAK
jgi:hypothetical protein